MIVLRGLMSLVLGTLLNLTAVTSVVVLGWLMRLMRGRAFAVTGQPALRATWVAGAPDRTGIARALGGLGANLREGINAALALAVATFPFAVFWLVAWWAGWENSFHKGYEQAIVGPAVGLSGVAVFAVIMLYLPLALAHQAVETRAWALFELRRVRSVVAHAGWSYVFWTLAMLVAALPVFAVRGVPVFAEAIHPAVADMSADEIAALKGGIDLALAAYVLVALVVLKGWSARIYAKAAARAAAGRDAVLWRGAAIAPAATGRRPVRLMRMLRGTLILAVWVAFAFLIFVGQFLNHNWLVWLTHPLIFLPWSP